MSESAPFYEVSFLSLNRHGEELCGDQVKLLRTPGQTLAVLSDGLGSGVKANILARLTAEIIVTMLREAAPLSEVLETVTGTLPTCKVRGTAYATFMVAQIQHASGQFRLVNLHSPPAFLLKQGRLSPLVVRTETLHGKPLVIAEGTLACGDFLGMMSDGVPGAGPGISLNPAWGWNHIGAWLEKAAAMRSYSADGLVRSVMRETQRLYGGVVGDDATFVGILSRPPRRLMVFTGPPADKTRDAACVTRLLEFEGKKVVCGGTTGNLVADHLGEVVTTDATTAREDVPPTGHLPEVDLVTEGILTLAKTLQLLQECEGDAQRLPFDRNGAVLLARELLQADAIFFLAGESVNPYYQNPMLPRSVSIRHNLVSQLAEVLVRYNKAVETRWC